MSTIGELIVKIGVDASSLKSGLSEATATIKSKMQDAEAGSKLLLGGLVAAGAGLVAFGAKSITMAGQVEQSQVAFTTMLGSAEKAAKLMKDLQAFGAETPFEFPEIQAAAKSLLAFGIGADEMKTKLQQIGDVSSAVGAPIGEIAEIYGKAKTSGRLFAEDINQLTGRGIPIIKELAKQFGVSEGEVKKLVEGGKVGFPELEKAFASMTGKGGQFHDMMKAQSNTLPGMWSNLMDNIGQSSVVFGQELIKAFNLKDKLAGVIKSLGEISTLLQQEGLKGALQKWFPPSTQATLAIIAGAILGGLVPAFYALAAGVWAAMVPLLPFMAAGAAVAALAYLIYKNWEPIKEFFPNLWNTIKEKTLAIWDAIKKFLLEWWPYLLGALAGPVGLLAAFIYKNWDAIKAKTIEIWNSVKDAVVGVWTSITTWGEKHWTNFKNMFLGIWAAIVGGLKGYVNGIIGMVNAVIGALNSIDVTIPNWVPEFGGNTFGINIPKVPMLAQGGIVTRPTLIMAGEAGSEAIVPLGKNGGIGSTITFNIYGATDPDAVSDAVMRKLALAGVK